MEGGLIMIRLTIANIKRYLKNHTLLINMVMLPIILIFHLIFLSTTQEINQCTFLQ